MLNNLSFPVCFRASVTPAQLSCSVCSPEPIEESQIVFAKTVTGDGLTLVETRRRLRGQDGDRVLAVSSYRCLDSRCRAEDSSIH